jgi:Mrp family chromosome partitioning ATPase
LNERQETPRPEILHRRLHLRPGIPVGRNLPKYSRAADQYRTLALRVEEMRPNLNPDLGYVVAVTGAEPGCGKTLSSLNLSLALARGWDRKVLLIEGDIWKPSLGEYLEIDPKSPGLVQVLVRGVKDREAVTAVCERGGEFPDAAFSVLPAGFTTDGEDLVGGPRMKALLDVLRARWERIILDCPPIELASGRALATYADMVLIVVRAGQTRQKQIERLLTALGPGRRVGMVLNAAREGNAQYDGYYA